MWQNSYFLFTYQSFLFISFGFFAFEEEMRFMLAETSAGGPTDSIVPRDIFT
jgi:hypothetical protein